jgi:hypothetical protein
MPIIPAAWEKETGGVPVQHKLGRKLMRLGLKTKVGVVTCGCGDLYL